MNFDDMHMEPTGPLTKVHLQVRSTGPESLDISVGGITLSLRGDAEEALWAARELLRVAGEMADKAGNPVDIGQALHEIDASIARRGDD